MTGPSPLSGSSLTVPKPDPAVSSTCLYPPSRVATRTVVEYAGSEFWSIPCSARSEGMLVSEKTAKP